MLTLFGVIAFVLLFTTPLPHKRLLAISDSISALCSSQLSSGTESWNQLGHPGGTTEMRAISSQKTQRSGSPAPVGEMQSRGTPHSPSDLCFPLHHDCNEKQKTYRLQVSSGNTGKQI